MGDGRYQIVKKKAQPAQNPGTVQGQKRAEPEPGRAKPPTGPTLPSVSAKRVLVIESDPSSLCMIDDALREFRRTDMRAVMGCQQAYVLIGKERPDIVVIGPNFMGKEQEILSFLRRYHPKAKAINFTKTGVQRSVEEAAKQQQEFDATIAKGDMKALAGRIRGLTT